VIVQHSAHGPIEHHRVFGRVDQVQEFVINHQNSNLEKLNH
jgi:hypothetical protein